MFHLQKLAFFIFLRSFAFINPTRWQSNDDSLLLNILMSLKTDTAANSGQEVFTTVVCCKCQAVLFAVHRFLSFDFGIERMLSANSFKFK